MANPSLNKFVGTWVWTSGADTVKIVLKKEMVQYPDDNYSEDQLIGFHHYRKAGNVVESNMNFVQTNFAAYKWSILAGNIGGNNIMLGTIKDLSKEKSIRITMTLNTAQTQMQLLIKEKPGIKINATTMGVFTLPNNITLIKQP